MKIVPAGPKAWDQADAVRRDFLARFQERRNPKTTATIDQLLDRYLDQHTGGGRTVTGYREYVDKHVRPFIGTRKVADLDAEILDSRGACRRVRWTRQSRRRSRRPTLSRPRRKKLRG